MLKADNQGWFVNMREKIKQRSNKLNNFKEMKKKI